VELSVHGRIRSVEGRKVRVDLALRAGGRTCATGEMLAVRLPEDE
jgi:predicted thioesterase